MTAVVLVGLALGASAAKRDPRSDGTRAMVATLARIGRDYDERLAKQQPDADLARYLRHARRGHPGRDQVVLSAGDAYTKLVHGDAAAAADELRAVRQAIRTEPGFANDHQLDNVVRDYLAIACMRRGEQENCVMHHTSQSCLLPIRGSGMHSAKEGAREAQAVYGEILDENPANLTARWLDNVAAMALGAWPDGVAPARRIDPECLASEGEMPRFLDVAPALGIAASKLGGGCVVGDFDRDGRADVMSSSAGLDPDRDGLRYFHNDGDGRFSDRTVEAGLEGLVGGVSLVQADFDNDGRLDVLVLRGGGLLGKLGEQPPSLLRNRGDGTFEDVTRKAGLFFLAPTASAAWADFDNDGWLDLFVGVQSSQLAGFDLPLYLRVEKPHMLSCKLFHNNRNGTFTDVAGELGVAITGYVQGTAFGDLDNDGWPDLVVSQRNGPVQVFHNDGASGGGFRRTQVLEPNHGAGLCLFDYDNDGALDLFVAGYSVGSSAYAAGQVAADYLGLPASAERPRLFHNRGDGTFENVTATSGLARATFATGIAAADFDGDGLCDLYVGTGARDFRALIPNRMFRNAGRGRFLDVTTAADVGHLQKAAAVAAGDLDADGAPDLYVNIGGEYPGDVFRNALFLNAAPAHHWIALRLEGTHANRSAVGARVRIAAADGNGTRDVFGYVQAASYGGGSLAVQTGLGDARSICELEVRWPGGQLERFGPVPVDRVLVVREGSGVVAPLDLTPLQLRGRPAPVADGGAGR